MIIIGETNLEANVDTGTHEEEFEHEIIECFDEELTKRGTRRHILHVRSKVLHTNI
jgi:hypothetical protein